MTPNTLNIQNEINLKSGYAAITLAAIINIVGFLVGASLFPFGAFAIVLCIISTITMIKSKKGTPAYAAVFGSLIFMSLAIMSDDIIKDIIRI